MIKKKSKKTIKKILVPLDGSKNSFRALDLATSIAQHYHSAIIGIYVIDIPLSMEYATVDPIGQHIHKKAERFFRKAKSSTVQKHIQFKSIIKHGKTVEEILKFAKTEKCDLIAIGKRGMGSVTEVILGSISHALIHKSKIPILIVK